MPVVELSYRRNKAMDNLQIDMHIVEILQREFLNTSLVLLIFNLTNCLCDKLLLVSRF